MRSLSSSSCKDLEEETLSLCITEFKGVLQNLGFRENAMECEDEDLRRVPGGDGGQEKRTGGEEGD